MLLRKHTVQPTEKTWSPERGTTTDICCALALKTKLFDQEHHHMEMLKERKMHPELPSPSLGGKIRITERAISRDSGYRQINHLTNQNWLTNIFTSYYYITWKELSHIMYNRFTVPLPTIKKKKKKSGRKKEPNNTFRAELRFRSKNLPYSLLGKRTWTKSGMADWRHC